jgi:hypothetical protein
MQMVFSRSFSGFRTEALRFQTASLSPVSVMGPPFIPNAGHRQDLYKIAVETAFRVDSPLFRSTGILVYCHQVGHPLRNCTLYPDV